MRIENSFSFCRCLLNGHLIEMVSDFRSFRFSSIRFTRLFRQSGFRK